MSQQYESEKYFQNEVFDLYVYDASGKLVAKLDSLKSSFLRNREEDIEIIAKDAALNVDLLRFLGSTIESPGNDFERDIKDKKYKTEVSFGVREYKQCKLIVRGHLKTNHEEPIGYAIEIPSAVASVDGLDIGGENKRLTVFDVRFTIKPYNDDGDHYIVKIQ